VIQRSTGDGRGGARDSALKRGMGGARDSTLKRGIGGGARDSALKRGMGGGRAGDSVLNRERDRPMCMLVNLKRRVDVAWPKPMH
jgi:hypothetical protein